MAGSRTNVVALNGSLGRPEAQADVLVPSPATLANTLAASAGAALLVVEENVRLLLESALALHGQLGGHDCCRWVVGCEISKPLAAKFKVGENGLGVWAWQL